MHILQIQRLYNYAQNCGCPRLILKFLSRQNPVQNVDIYHNSIRFNNHFQQNQMIKYSTLLLLLLVLTVEKTFVFNRYTTTSDVQSFEDQQQNEDDDGGTTDQPANQETSDQEDNQTSKITEYTNQDDTLDYQQDEQNQNNIDEAQSQVSQDELDLQQDQESDNNGDTSGYDDDDDTPNEEKQELGDDNDNSDQDFNDDLIIQDDLEDSEEEDQQQTNAVSNYTGYLNKLKNTYESDDQSFKIYQYYVGSIAIYTYIVQSGDQVFLIDPLAQIEQYEQIIKAPGKTVKGVALTHYHADYIAGHLEIKNRFKCEIYIGPEGKELFGFNVLKQGQQIEVGNIKLKTIHTPGHTQQSSCFLLVDQSDTPKYLFTGDTLFMEEVGRPDLAVKTTLPVTKLAGFLFNSLQKLKQLDDDIIFLPGHGAGSACGKNIAQGDSNTLGQQKKRNYGFTQQKKNSFIKKVINDMPTPPQYFGYASQINKYEPFDYQGDFEDSMYELVADEVVSGIKKGAKVIDVRTRKQLQKGIIKTSVTIDFDGQLQFWAGTVFSPSTQFIVYGPRDKAMWGVKRLFRIGYTNIIGFSEAELSGFKTYKPEFVPNINLKNHINLDVRRKQEWRDGIAAGKTALIELSRLYQQHQRLSKSKKYVIYCRSGYRARIAYSILKSLGYDVKAFVDGGFPNFKKMGVKVVKPKM